MDVKIFLTTFATLFLAELGDKTQLACIMLAAKTKCPFTVLAGASAALVLVSLLGVLLANVLTQLLPVELIKKASGIGFICIGILILGNKL